MKKLRRSVKRILACMLSLMLTLQTIPVYAEGEITEVEVQELEAEEIVTEEEIVEDDELTSDTSELTDITQIYENGCIKIYNLSQLEAIGSEVTVRTSDYDEAAFGMGEAVTVDGEHIVYGLDSQYMLMDDIVLDANDIWTLPDGFTGTFCGEAVEEDAPLYDAETDTIYVYHNYQLIIIQDEGSAEEPVMSMDMLPSQFGIGQFLYPYGTEDGQNYLTYSKDHQYVLAKNFTEEMPEMEASIYATTGATTDEQLGGRAHVGQVYTEIGDVKYILIGNEQQLEAIGSGKQVTPMLFLRMESKLLGGITLSTSIAPYYSGDADINLTNINKTGIRYEDVNDNALSFQYTDTELMNADFSDMDNLLEGIVSLVGGLLEGILGLLGAPDYQLVGLVYDETTGVASISEDTYTDASAIQSEYINLKYDIDANYIVFRNIDLASGDFSDGKDDNWIPLMFSGIMEGRLNMEKGAVPRISNVRVEQTDEISVDEYIGVGFFATITNEINTSNVGVSAGTVKVSNIELYNVTVQNNTDDVESTETILNALTSGLGWIVGGVVDLLTGVLTFGQVSLTLRDTLSALLNARADDPTIFATGAFAGRIVGDVQIAGCSVTGTVNVTNMNDRTGGFVGYAEGMTEYDGLSDALGLTADVLASLLNAIPGLGLGDLITILLKNALPLGSLIPTGYINPVITNCKVDGLTGTLGSSNGEYIGGFIGQQVGTHITKASVTNSNYKIIAKTYGGGFSGIARDAEIKGLLSDVGIELVRVTLPQSKLIECQILDSQVSINGGDNLGGFEGAMANSYAVNCTIQCTELNVSGTGSSIGGFTGIATVGWITNLGKDSVTNNSLLSTVKELLTGLLSSDPSKAQMLLTLVGIAPSAILGCQISGGKITVHADGSYAGGLVGKGDGLYLADSSEAYLEKFYSSSDSITQRSCKLSGLEEVSAGGDYAGGVAGSVGTASVSGLLNGTLGLAQFLGFTIENVTVSGVDSGYKVSATNNYAGGGFGEAVGGTISSTTLSALKNVVAKNRAGGFAGITGPGDLAGTGGLKLSLLGLDILEVKNLLSLGQGVTVKIKDSTVTGIEEGYTVEATGQNANGEVIKYTAGGFVAKSNSTEISNSHAKNLKSVVAAGQDGYAGGYLGTSETGGLAEVADEESILDLVKVDGLVNAIEYLIPDYTNCTVTYVDGGGVEADVAGGFAADFQSGKVNNEDRGENDYYSVYNIEYVKGQTYAGGFGGRVYSGALAAAGGGISILGNINGLSISLDDLLNVVEAYVPYVKYAGIYSKNGFTVEAKKLSDTDLSAGSAGGFIGYASGAQISTCDVNRLKNTKVVPPDDLEAVNAPSYFEGQSAYAVTGGRYAGGFVGDMDIGSAASVGGGLKVLGNTIQLSNVLSALSVVVTTIEYSNVYGQVGGFSVLSDGTDSHGAVGMAGGYAGLIKGGHIQNSHVENFSYIIGQIAAGGYVGEMRPGDIASLLDETGGGLLENLVDVTGLLSVGQTFIPTIQNSHTTCIPCGGAVRAHSASDSIVDRGMAGGYVGHNDGGQIWGNSSRDWKAEDYTGEQTECAVIRLRSVYGYEYAGGFTGLMECASTADLGSVEILNGLIKLDNVLGLLNAMYPTEENTAVYGPLRELDIQTWNSWVEHVAGDKSYGQWIRQVETQTDLEEMIATYAYGYNVVAGRNITRIDGNKLMSNGGNAGGYNGAMIGGTVTNAHAQDVKFVSSVRCAGGFSGEMVTGGVATVGDVSLLGLLDLGVDEILQAVEVFVPVVKKSSVTGYQSGAEIEAFGTEKDVQHGHAGGYVGSVTGGQIWGTEGSPCIAENIKSVKGSYAVGGFAGRLDPGSVADVHLDNSGGLLSGLLDLLLGSTDNLANVLQATVTTVRYAQVKGYQDGLQIGGYGSSTPDYAGGFVGSMTGTVLGDMDEEDGIQAKNIRSVTGGYYAGGFVGLADVGSVASISDDSATSILGLIEAGNISVLDVFRTYIYEAEVTGSSQGLTVSADRQEKFGEQEAIVYSGCAGGFSGAVLNGSVKESGLSGLRSVRSLNYSGGFAGHLGKSGAVDIDSTDVNGGILGVTAGVLDVCGSTIENCDISGIADGFTVISSGGIEEIAGGYVGLADLARISDSDVIGLSIVQSDEIAGGFAGKTTMAYLVDAEVNSEIVNLVLLVVNALIELLYLDDLQDVGVIDIGLGNVLDVKLLADGKTLSVTLLGLTISVALSRADAEEGGEDVAIITIGDSVVKLPCNEDGVTSTDTSNIQINLIKANRTKIQNSTVTGINTGYDVFAGGADKSTDGIGDKGIVGGFVGFNDEGYILNNNMYLADIIRGTDKKVGEFIGRADLTSNYQDLSDIVGDDNYYRIYRSPDTDLTQVQNAEGTTFQTAFAEETVGVNTYNVYTVLHYDVVKDHDDYHGAVMTDTSGGSQTSLEVWVSGAQANLMDGVVASTSEELIPDTPQMQDPCDDVIQLEIQKVWKDFSNPNRPDIIQVKVTRSYTLEDGTITQDTEFAKELTLTGENNVWKAFAYDLPVYHNEYDENGNLTASYPYMYDVEEIKDTEVLQSYKTTYEWDEYHYSVVITNVNYMILPDTGGFGIIPLMVLGVFIIEVLILTGRRKRKGGMQE